MRGNQFIQGVMDFANMALEDANSANFALGELIGGGYQQRQEPVPTAGAQAQGDTRQIGNVEIPMRERQEGETSGRPRPSSLDGQRQEAPPAPTNVRMLNQNATRRLPVNDTLASNIGNAIESVYGPGFEARIYSGGQPPQGKGPRTGSVRHDEGRAADLYIYGPDGERLRGDALAPIAQFWKANKLGGVGLEMAGGGIHLDDWTEPPPGGGMSWSYGGLTATQRAAIEAGARGELPPLAQEWAGMVVGEGNEVNASNLYNSLSGALTTSMSTSGQMGQPSQGGAAGVSGPAGSAQVEELIGGMVRDIFGPEDGDTQRARAHKSSIWENLSVSLGQMAAGQPVNVSSVLRAQEQSQQQIVVNRMEQHRMRAGAAAVLDSGGSPAMAQAVATGALSFSDVLNERQISTAEAQLARENMQDDTRRDAFRNALAAQGYPEELTNIDPRDLGSFVSLENLRIANEAAELAAVKEEDQREGRMQVMESLFQSDNPDDQKTARAMALNPEMTTAEAQESWQEAQKRDLALAEQRRQALEGDQEAARAEQERIATDRQMAQLRQTPDAPKFEREMLKQYDRTGGTITAAEAAERAAAALEVPTTTIGGRLVDTRTGQELYVSPEARESERGVEGAQAEREATDMWASSLLDVFEAGQELDPVARRALELYGLSGGNMTAREATQQAAEELDLDPVVVGNNIVSRQTGDVLYEGPGNKPAVQLVYEESRRQAAERGEDALAEFDERFPTLADFRLTEAGRMGGIGEERFSGAILDTNQLPTSTISEDFDPDRVFGAIGFGVDFANTFTELVTGRLSDPQSRRAATELNRLATSSLIENAASVAGRPSNYLLEKFEELETRPTRILTGAETARLRMQNQLEAVESGIEINNRVLSSPAFSEKMREEAAMGNERLGRLLQDYRTVLGAFDRAGIGEVQTDVEVRSFDSPDDVRGALESGIIQPGDTVTVNGRQFRVRARGND